MILRTCRDSCLNSQWICVNKLCIHTKTCCSIRIGSLFENISTPFTTILKVLVYWSRGLNQSEIIKFINISRPTVGKIRSLFLSVIAAYFLRNPIKLGGPGVVVQCDETLLNHKIKYHKGRVPRSQVWALTIVDTSFTPARGWIEIVPNRKKETLLPIICGVVLNGTIIHSDEWVSYRDLAKMNSYEHMTVVHKYNFVCPVTGTHTQNVESWNNKLKLKIKEMRGLNTVGRSNFVHEFCFLEMFRSDAYEKMLELLKCNIC